MGKKNMYLELFIAEKLREKERQPIDAHFLFTDAYAAEAKSLSIYDKLNRTFPSEVLILAHGDNGALVVAFDEKDMDNAKIYMISNDHINLDRRTKKVEYVVLTQDLPYIEYPMALLKARK